MTEKIIKKITEPPYSYFISCLLIILFAFIVYLQTTEFGLIGYDDGLYISANPHFLAGFTYDNFIWSVSQILNSNWAPLTIWSYITDASIYERWYGGYHLTNIILHAINGILLFLIALRLSKIPLAALLLAILFVVHPQHVESVAWLSQRKDLLSTLFMFLSLYFYLVYKTKDIRHYYFLSIGAFMIGLMAKVIIAPLPLVLILLDYVFFSSKENRNYQYLLSILLNKTPYFLLALLFGGINYYAQFSSGAFGHTATVPIDIRLSVIPLAYWFYPIKTLLPVNLIPFYPYPSEAPIIQSIIAFALLFAVTIFLFLNRHKYKYLFFGWFLYLILSSPMNGLFYTGGHAYADRYSYIANIGLLLIIVAAIYKMSSTFSARLLGVFVIIYVLALTYLSYMQTSQWKDTNTLFSYTLGVQDDNYLALIKVANEQIREGRTYEAETLIERAIETNPHEARVYQFAAKYIYAKKDYKGAKALLEDALEFNIWQKGVIFRELAQYYLLEKDYEKAINYATQAIESKHEIEAAYMVRGIAYRDSGGIAKAIDDIQKAISINHQYTKAYIVMGDILMSIGQEQDALPYYKHALKKNPNNTKLKAVISQIE